MEVNGPDERSGRAHVVDDPMEAEDICCRHNRQFRLEKIIAAIRTVSEGDSGPINDVRRMIRARGAFLMEYSRERIAARIASPRSWVVTRRMSIEVGEGHLGGDCQVELPEDSPSARPLVHLPASPADCTPAGHRIVGEIRKCPAIAAQVADLCADDEVRGRGYASAAKCLAYTRIRELNRARVRKIRFVLGEMFVIKGVRLPDGSEIRLAEFGHPALVNKASMRANTCGPDAAIEAWTVRDWHEYIPPAKGGEVLLTDWIVLARDLESL